MIRLWNKLFVPAKALIIGTLLGTALLSTVSCASLPKDTPIPSANILMARKDGTPVDPSKRFEVLTPKAYDKYVNDVFRGLSDYCQGKPKPCQALLFFHGGLNSQRGSVGRVTSLAKDIKDSGSYPIFVNWNSSLPSTWWSHVAHVHKGIFFGNRLAIFFPYFAAVDEVKSLVDAPSAWVAEARHTFVRFGPQNHSLKAYKTLVNDREAGHLIVNDIFEGESLRDDRSQTQKLTSYATFPLTLPTKLISPPLLIQAAGTGAWDLMERRTSLLFRTEDEFRGVPPEKIAEKRQASSPSQAGRAPETGAALAYFITRFQRDFLPVFCSEGKYPSSSPGSELTSTPQEQEPKISENSELACEDRLQITLVGHSMGTIIVDQLLRYAPNMKVKNIVFMAAANSVEDYRNTVIPYLERHPKTKMYHLILHPRAEVSEKGFLDLSPRGSLLVWIDNYFTNPITPLDRMAGRFSNLLPELLYTDENLRDRVHLKVFRVGKPVRCSNPQKHGDFGKFPFWDPNFWDPTIPAEGQEAPYIRQSTKWRDRKCSLRPLPQTGNLTSD